MQPSQPRIKGFSLGTITGQRREGIFAGIMTLTRKASQAGAVMLVGITLICAGFSVGFGVAMSQALGPFSLRAGVASSVLGIAQVCGSSLWIWLAAVVGLNALNMLIGVLIGCSIVCITLLMVI